MGEVYRARDSKLKRDVALKVLPAEVAGDRERLARFQREAEVLAALNHHHIAHLHGVEESNGTTALVMELVEGEDLAQRIQRGRVPVDEALQIASEIADALDAAHSIGIIHRDLKPANIKLRPDGAVKVLDFGLAKALDPGAGSGEPANALASDLAKSPTITSPAMTLRGVILGTAPYMSPEQAKGKPVDKRADIWAFGCVLYEMLTGRRAFDGETTTETLAAVLERDPDWTALPEATPPEVHRLLRRTLQKKTALRLRDIGDAKADLAAGTDGAARATRPRSKILPIAFAVGVAAALGAGYFAGRGAAVPPSQPPLVFTLPVNATQVPISADGSTIAWLAPGSDRITRLWVRRLQEKDARELKGTEDATQPFLAPDGRAVGFFQHGLLKRVDVDSGSVQTLTTSAVVSPGGSWSVDDVILFSNRQGLQRIAAGGGEPQLVVPLNAQYRENSLRFPHFLPDGRHFVFVARSGAPEESGAYLGSLDGPPRRLFNTLGKIMFARPDQLLLVRDGTLMAQGFDVRSGALSEPARIITSDLFVQPTGLNAFYSASDNGTVVYVPARPEPTARLRWFDRSGRDLGGLGESHSYSQFRLAPDGARVVAAIGNPRRGQRSVWLLESGRPTSRVTLPDTHDWQPVWSPDGRRIAFATYRNGPNDIYIKDVNGAGGDVALLRSDTQKDVGDWSPDGKYLAYRETRDNANGDIIAVEVANPSRAFPITDSNNDERMPRWSGDGKWMAYVSNETGEVEVFVQPFPPTGARWQVSVGGGDEPAWSGDGRELYYINNQDMLIAVTVNGTAASFAQVRSQPLLRAGSTLGRGFGNRYDVARDGRRFLVQVDEPQPPPRPPVVIVNWPALSRAR